LVLFLIRSIFFLCKYVIFVFFPSPIHVTTNNNNRLFRFFFPDLFGFWICLYMCIKTIFFFVLTLGLFVSSLFFLDLIVFFVYFSSLRTWSNCKIQ
jgi:hypothetical protein